VDENVRRVTVVSNGSSGPAADVVFEKRAGRDRTSRQLKPLKKMQRRTLKAQKVFADEALALHEKYALKRKNGWLRDAPTIVFKANRKALKKLINW
jgi:Family of unknown function (DUF6312)